MTASRLADTARTSFTDRAAACLHQNTKSNVIKTYLLQLIDAKKTNLCLSADVTSTSTLLRLADACGPYICILKTHSDIIDDFGPRTIKGLRELSRKHKFLIFEDRKFGDIGATVSAQYTRGPLQIATWAHIVNAHVFPGPGIVKTLRQAAESVVDAEARGVVSTEVWVGTPAASEDEQELVAAVEDVQVNRKPLQKQAGKLSNSRKDSIVANTTIFQTVEVSSSLQQPRSQSQSPAGELQKQLELQEDTQALDNLGEPPIAKALLLFAQMSSEGNLMDEEYTRKTVDMARQNKDFVIGYIAQSNLNTASDDDFLILTPGVQLPPKGSENEKVTGDGLGQQYRTPAVVVGKDGCDVVIVGRGIYEAKNKIEEAERYREEAWRAYQARLGS